MKPFFADEIKFLSYPDAEVLYDGEDGLLYYGKTDGSLYARAETESAAEIIRALIPSFARLICARGPLDFGEPDTCYHVEYNGAPIEIPKSDFTFRTLEKSDLPWLAANYHSDESYLSRLIEKGYMTGAFENGTPAGFIGMHERGSMGLLFVEEKFRRRGLGYLLEAYKINEVLKNGDTPFAHIREYNAPSLGLQRKLGMTVFDKRVKWFSLK